MTAKRYLDGAVTRAHDDGGDDNVFTFTASTQDPDRAGDIVVQQWALANWESNPVILLNHDMSGPVVGVGLSAEVVERELVIRLRIDAHEDNPAAARLARQIRDGVVSAGSVGFLPGQVSRRSEMPADHPFTGERGLVLGSTDSPNELLEFSIVTVPMNAGALAAKAMSEADTRRIIREEVSAALEAQKAIAAVCPDAPEDFFASTFFGSAD